MEELGRVEGLARRGGATLLKIRAAKTLEDTRIGDSIAVNGACLTVVKIEKGNFIHSPRLSAGLSISLHETSGFNSGSFIFEVIPQTLQDTNLGNLKSGERVNLERGLKIGGRLSGHFVTGHIDCLGIIRKKNYRSGNLAFEIAVPAQFIKYCLDKGSIAVDGISLTLQEKKSNTFSVYLIPHTHAETTLGLKCPSDKVNIEFDLLVKAALQNHC